MPIKEIPHYRNVNGVTSEWFYREQITYSTSRKVNGVYTAFLPCNHKKLVTAGSYHKYSGGFVSNWTYPDQIPWADLISYGLSQAHIGLDFQENNNFELIPFLMDWDSTMAMFAKKFFRELSYGAVTWGVMPLMSDLTSLAATLQDINDGVLKSYEKIIGKRISRRFEWTKEFSNFYSRTVTTGHTTIYGTVSGDLIYPDSPVKAMATFLDEIGFHPDLKTAWDVVPLSFVVDYFLPIGDFLESLSPRGWFRPNFVVTGGYSVKCKIDQFLTHNYGGEGAGPSSWTYYVRSPAVLNLQSRPTVEPKYEVPSFRELFNSLYLGTGLKNAF